MKLDVVDNQLGDHKFQTLRWKPDVGTPTNKPIRTKLTMVLSGGKTRLPCVNDMRTQAFNECLGNRADCERVSDSEPADRSYGGTGVSLTLRREIGVEHDCYSDGRCFLVGSESIE